MAAALLTEEVHPAVGCPLSAQIGVSDVVWALGQALAARGLARQADMQQKAFCDKEMAQSTKSKESKEDRQIARGSSVLAGRGARVEALGARQIAWGQGPRNQTHRTLPKHLRHGPPDDCPTKTQARGHEPLSSKFGSVVQQPATLG